MLEILNGKRNEIDSVKILSHIGYYVFLNKKIGIISLLLIFS